MLTETAIVHQLRSAGCVFAEEEARILVESAPSSAGLAAMVARRVAGEPLEQVVGWVEFCGLRIEVDPGVFVPRQRSELLVREAVARTRAARDLDPDIDDRGLTIVDLGCGCGALGLSAWTLLGHGRVFAVEIDPAAVRCSRRNLERAGGHVYLGDFYEPLPRSLRGGVDLIVANVPYVPTDEVRLMPREARDHEPLVALDGGPDGLDQLRRVVGPAADWLAPGGHVLLETSTGQVPAAIAAIGAAGLRPATVHDDDLYATVVIGQRPT